MRTRPAWHPFPNTSAEGRSFRTERLWRLADYATALKWKAIDEHATGERIRHLRDRERNLHAQASKGWSPEQAEPWDGVAQPYNTFNTAPATR